MTVQPLNLPDLGPDTPPDVAAALEKLTDLRTRHAAAWAERDQAVAEAAALEAGAVERYAELLAEADLPYDATDERTARERVVDLERKVEALEHAHAVARGRVLDLVTAHRKAWTADLDGKTTAAATKAAAKLAAASAAVDELVRLLRVARWLTEPASGAWERVGTDAEPHLSALLDYVQRRGQATPPTFRGIRGQDAQHLPVAQFAGQQAN